MATRQDFSGGEALLQLALISGQGQNRDRRFSQGQQLVVGLRQQQAQQDALRLENRKLDLQAQQARRAFSTPTSGRGGSPFTRSASDANAAFKAPQSLGLDPVTAGALQVAERTGDRATVQRILQEAMGRQNQRIGPAGTGTVGGGDSVFEIDQEGNLTGTEDNRQLSERELEQRGGFAGPGQRPRGDDLRARKQGFVDQLLNLSPNVRQALQFLIDDPSITLQQTAIRANSMKEEQSLTSVTKNQRLSFERSLIREEVEDVDRQIRQITELLNSEEFNINTVGRDLDTIRQELAAGDPSNMFGFGGTDPRPEAAGLIEQLQRLNAQKEALRGQEDSLIGQAISQFQSQESPNGLPSDNVGVGGMSDEQLRALAGL